MNTTKTQDAMTAQTKHTPGPWRADGDTVRAHQDSMTGSRWNETSVLDLSREPEVRRANAARIVACVNACEGLALDGGDTFGTIRGVLAERDAQALELIALRAERDALRAQLAEVVGALEFVTRSDVLYQWANEKDIGRDEWNRRSDVINRVHAALVAARSTGKE